MIRRNLLSFLIKKENEEEDTGVGEILDIHPLHYITFTGSNMTITPNFTEPSVVLAYSMNNGKVWHKIDAKTETPAGDKILFVGTSNKTRLFTANNANNSWILNATDGVNVSGNIMSLVMDNFNDSSPKTKFQGTTSNYAFAYMFTNNSTILTSPELPATELSNNCYAYMFRSCPNLIVAPELPATVLGNNCYQQMFYGCKLITGPCILPATTLASACYGAMFQGCLALTEVYVYASETTSSYFSNWLSGVYSTGTLYKAGEQFASIGNSSYPKNWTQVQI